MSAFNDMDPAVSSENRPIREGGRLMRRRIMTVSSSRTEYPWDYRVEYVQSPGTAYFLLNKELPTPPVPPDGRDELWHVKLEIPGTVNYDRKIFGRVLQFSLDIYRYCWRYSAFGTGWPAVDSLRVEKNRIMVYEVDNSQIRLMSPDGTATLYSASNDLLGGDPRIRVPGLDFAVGSSVGYDERHFWAQSDGVQTHNIYSFWRKIEGEYEFNLIPCVVNGEAGFLDTVSGKFMKSISSVPFTAGPRVADDGSAL